MAVSKNKERVMISLEKELLKYIKERSKKNERTISDEIAILFENLKLSEEKTK